MTIIDKLTHMQEGLILEKNRVFEELLTGIIRDFRFKRELKIYKYYIVFIIFDSNNLNELRNFKISPPEKLKEEEWKKIREENGIPEGGAMQIEIS